MTTEHFYMGDEGDGKVLWPTNVFAENPVRTPLEERQRQEHINSKVQTKPLRVVQGSDGVRTIQVGGNHYKDKAMQPWDIIDAWGLDFYEGNVLKYLLRAKYKNGVEDLKKARHYLDKKIEDADAS